MGKLDSQLPGKFSHTDAFKQDLEVRFERYDAKRWRSPLKEEVKRWIRDFFQEWENHYYLANPSGGDATSVPRYLAVYGIALDSPLQFYVNDLSRSIVFDSHTSADGSMDFLIFLLPSLSRNETNYVLVYDKDEKVQLLTPRQGLEKILEGLDSLSRV